jgi:undecaprenyl-diphosphatase
MIVLWPHGRLWDLSPAPWLTSLVIALSIGAALLAVAVLLAAWFRSNGLRCILSVGLAFVATVLVCKVISHFVFVARPFVAHEFTPLFPHVANTSFPSSLTAFFALVASTVFLAWRRMGWLLVGVTLWVGIACVYVGVHYLTDVLVGAILGGGFGALAWFTLGLPVTASHVESLDRILKKFHLRPASPFGIPAAEDGV